MKSKTTAGIYAFFFGTLGLHRFYLGQRKLGMLYFMATIGLFLFSIAVDGPVVFIMCLVAFIDAMILFAMPQVDFDEKYNEKYIGEQRQTVVAPPIRQRRPVPVALPECNPAKAAGIEKFKDYDYDGALEDFKKSLSTKFDDPAVHFNLACCYSLMERPDPAFFHLTKAVHFGFVDFDKIEKHEGLAHLRTQPEFKDFVKKGYQLHTSTPLEPEATNDLLSQMPTEIPIAIGTSLLDQIKRLSDLREQGILTNEEFMGMKGELKMEN